MNKCALCGTDLPLNAPQISLATKNKGIESACIIHEFSDKLQKYIQDNGGIIPINEALKEREEK